MLYLALVLDKKTEKEIAEFQIEAESTWWAKHKVACEFSDKQKWQPNLRKHTDWYVDAVAL